MDNDDRLKSRTWAEIDLAALLHNLNYAKKCANNRPVMCVIKANAYGHGAVECAKFLEKNGAAAFAVACLDEAVELRRAGIKLPILILGYTPAKYADIIANNDIIQTLVDLSYAEELSASAKKAGVTVNAHIKLDTGMSRTGILAQGENFIQSAIDAACREIELPNIDVEGMYTHMSVADTPSEDEYTNWQIDNYIAVREGILKRGYKLKCCHMANSAGIMNHPRTHFDMVREGITLYGLYPDSIHVENGPLQPVMTMKSRVGLVREFPAGTTISYGRMFKAQTDMRVAVITAGYADGFPWHMYNKAIFTINGEEFKQIGRVCMDMMMVDVTGSNVKRDDEVILFGKGGMSIETVAAITQTIDYELVCLITPRTKRVYING